MTAAIYAMTEDEEVALIDMLRALKFPHGESHDVLADTVEMFDEFNARFLAELSRSPERLDALINDNLGLYNACLDYQLAFGRHQIRVNADGDGDIENETIEYFDLEELNRKVSEWTGAVAMMIGESAKGQRKPRKTRATFNRKMQPIVDAIKAVFERFEPPLTVRQVYYQLASSGLVQLSDEGYSQAQRLQLKLREIGEIRWDWYADRARERMQASTWDNTADFADSISDCYRKDLWQAQPEHVEFWLEKDALSAFVSGALETWGNPLCVVRGFSSGTFVHECAEILKRIDKPKYIYYLGDHDPSGLAIEENVQERLTEFGAEFHFQRLAVSLDDIDTYGLRPLVAKKADTRYKAYVAKHGTRTVEVDALPPDVLRDRIGDAVRRHIDIDAWNRLARVERIEQDTVRSIADRMRNLAVQP